MDYNNPDRPRGILTADDRRFLLGEKEFKHQQSKTNARSRIRKRVANGILDFGLIYYHLRDEDIWQIFEYDNETERLSLDHSIVELISLVYFGTTGFHPPFETLLKRGVSQGEQRIASPGRREVSIDFEVETSQRYFTESDVEYLVERAESRGIGALSHEDKMTLFRLARESDGFDPEMAMEGWENMKGTEQGDLDRGSEAVAMKRRERWNQLQGNIDDAREEEAGGGDGDETRQ